MQNISCSLVTVDVLRAIRDEIHALHIVSVYIVKKKDFNRMLSLTNLEGPLTHLTDK